MSQPIKTLREDDIQALAVMREQANQGEIDYWQIYSIQPLQNKKAGLKTQPCILTR